MLVRQLPKVLPLRKLRRLYSKVAAAGDLRPTRVVIGLIAPIANTPTASGESEAIDACVDPPYEEKHYLQCDVVSLSLCIFIVVMCVSCVACSSRCCLLYLTSLETRYAASGHADF